MNWHSIIFSSKMVRAILEGKKSQTRRVLKKQPGFVFYGNEKYTWKVSGGDYSKDKVLKCRYGNSGDFLYVLEKYRAEELDDGLDGVRYEADNSFIKITNTQQAADDWLKIYNEDLVLENKWKNPLFMSRWVSRIFLKIINVDLKKLHNISEDDIRKEGIFLPPQFTGIINGEPVENDAWWDSDRKEMKDPWSFFAEDWDMINAKRGYPWKTNPWVWVVEFQVHKILS